MVGNRYEQVAAGEKVSGKGVRKRCQEKVSGKGVSEEKVSGTFVRKRCQEPLSGKGVSDCLGRSS
jgi:hypothetical protein